MRDERTTPLSVGRYARQVLSQRQARPATHPYYVDPATAQQYEQGAEGDPYGSRRGSAAAAAGPQGYESAVDANPLDMGPQRGSYGRSPASHDSVRDDATATARREGGGWDEEVVVEGQLPAGGFFNEGGGLLGCDGARVGKRPRTGGI